MSFYQVKMKGTTNKQGRIVSYALDFDIDIENIGIKLEGFLAKPKENSKNAIFDNFNEVMRERCYSFIESHGLTLKNGTEVSGTVLYNTIMQMMCDAINEINERGDSMFMVKVSDTQLRKAGKTRNKTLVEELEKQKRYDAELEIEIAKQKIINETKEQMLRSTKFAESLEKPVYTITSNVVEEPREIIKEPPVGAKIVVEKITKREKSIGKASMSENPGALRGS